jgi:pyruvate/2-oxoglutarate dehydrogenase complex dihydrolipoamide dehydrogenase (E3) component
VKAYDVIVIGAGPAGEVVAGRLGAAGLAVALAEQELIGGECSFYACMPSKGLLRPGQALDEVRRIPGAAEAATGDLDVDAVFARRDEIIHELDDSGMLPWLDERGVKLHRGHARLAGERRVEVDGEELEARRAVVIATGTHALLPPIPGLAEATPWTNREATTGSTVPNRLIVLGGGPVGCEMAQAYRSLGSEVALVEGEDRLLPREEPYASAELRDAMEASGIEVLTGIRATSVRRDGTVTVELDDGSSREADELLCALGRRTLSDDLGLDTVGLEGGHAIEVGDDLRVPGHDWLYVVGDANGRILLTHMGKYQARIVADRITGTERELRLDGGRSPRVTFTEPQVAAVGHTLDAAREAGHDAFAVEAGTSENAGGSFYGRNVAGTARLVVERESSRVLGATLVGAEIAEFLQAATILVSAGLTMDDLWHAVPSFPTRSEVWLYLTEAWEREIR